MLPSGTLTFLFTDIEGSTQRWDRDRAAMQNAVRRHDAILREAIEGAGGTVFKTIGDAFCAVFARPEAAVAAILGSQRALAREDFSEIDGLRVRMALHTGTADERDGDYYGPVLNRVARLLAVGHGGQMLLSRLTADLVRDTLPGSVTLRELGLHKLKDLAEPEHVHQLVSQDLPHEFPPLRSAGAVPNNLPAETSSFVGRETELRDVAAALEANRIVTLLGMGGIGKTRLSLQVGAGVIDRFSNGVWFVEFAATNDAALVPGTIASTVGVAEAPGRSALETLIPHLKHETVLLILDNCEHLIGEIARTADAIVRACPKVKILASSREPLGVTGEVAYRLSTLGTAEAVALFAARATAANRQFAVTSENEPVVTEICRRLDGIALAIELAAARAKMLAPKALLEKLDDRFRVVAGGSRTALPRQQTLRALIDWSYDLLSDAERTLFRRLAIFAGGFTLDLCTAVCADETIDEFDVGELLAALVDKSLVHVEIVGDETRYDLLESIREYAREKLTESGELKVTSTAHAEAYLKLAEAVEGEHERTSDARWNARARPEIENWRTALAALFEAGSDDTLGKRLVAALRPFWATFAIAEGRGWISKALEDGEKCEAAVVARLLLARAHLAMLGTNYREAFEASKRVLQLDVQSDALSRARAKLFAGASSEFLGEDFDGRSLLKEALAEGQNLGASRLMAAALVYSGAVRAAKGEAADARGFLGEALAIYKSIGAERPAAHISLNLAEIEFECGDVDRAIGLVSSALAMDREFGNEDGVIYDLCNLSAYLVASESYAEAALFAKEAIALATEAGMEAAAAYALHHYAAILALQPADDVRESLERSARLMGYVDAQLSRHGLQREYTERREYERTLEALKERLSESELLEHMDCGAAWTAQQAVAAVVVPKT